MGQGRGSSRLTSAFVILRCSEISASRSTRAGNCREDEMAEEQAQPVGPDLALGVRANELPDGGKLVGHVGQDPVLLVRRAAHVFAIGAHCTHYNGPLAEGPSLSRIRCDVRGITPASIFAPEKRCARRPSVRSIRGAWMSATAKSLSARSALSQRRRAAESGTNQTRL